MRSSTSINNHYVLLLPFIQFRFGRCLFHPAFFFFLWVLLINTFSILYEYVSLYIRIILPYADLTFFCFVWGTWYKICFSYSYILLCVLISRFLFYVFVSSRRNLPVQSYWSLSREHGLHCVLSTQRHIYQQYHQSVSFLILHPRDTKFCGHRQWGRKKTTVAKQSR